MLTIVIAKYLFIEITKQMKRFNTYIGSRDATFKEAPEVLKAIGMYFAVYIFFGMVYNLMGILFGKSIIRTKGIGIKGGSRFNMSPDLSMKDFLFPFINHSSLYFPSAFEGSKNNGLIFPASTSDAALTFINVHITRLAADEGFINFDFALQFIRIFILQSKSDSVKHKPCGFLSDIKITCHLIAAYTVLAIGQHPYSGKPFIKTDSGVLENSSDLDRKFPLRMVSRTLPSPAFRIEGTDALGATRRTRNAVRPSLVSEIVNAVVQIRKINDCFLQGIRFFSHVLNLHENTVSQFDGRVKYIIALI